VKYKNYEEIIKRVFGDRVPEEYYKLFNKLLLVEDEFETAKCDNTLQPHHYQRFNKCKSDLFDFLNTTDGLIVIGKLKDVL